MSDLLDTVTKPITRQNIEAYLDRGDLFVQMKSRRWWRLRRNGSTRTWKRDTDRFEIPVKFGLRNYGKLSNDGLRNGVYDSSDVRHVDDIPPGLR